jgi:hypothetical protein
VSQRKVRVVVCDLHEGSALAEETVRFSLDRRDYLIDVCAAHAEELRDDLEEFVGPARRLPRQRAR